jgi:hypothetical protein
MYSQLENMHFKYHIGISYAKQKLNKRKKGFIEILLPFRPTESFISIPVNRQKNNTLLYKPVRMDSAQIYHTASCCSTYNSYS